MAGRAFLVVSCLSAVLALPSARAAAGDWHEWRGPLRTGESPSADPPVEWAEGKNVKWKVDVPGLGLGTPIVTGELVLVSTAAAGEKDAAAKAFVVMAFDRKSGALRWKSVVHEEM